MNCPRIARNLAATIVLTLVASLAPVVAAEDGVAEADLSVGNMQVLWKTGKNFSVRYRDVEAFLPIPEEFVTHNEGWKQVPFTSSRRTPSGRVTERDGVKALVVTDADEGFSYTRTLSVRPDDSVVIEYEYGQTGRADIGLALGYRPAIPWLEGATFDVLSGGKQDRGRMTYGRAEKRVLWTSRDYRFGSAFGVWRLTTTRDLTLYDDRDKGSFFLGWDQGLERDKRYTAKVEIRFEPTPQTFEGVTVSGLQWSRETELGRASVSLDLARAAGGPDKAKVRLEAIQGDKSMASVEATPTLGPIPARTMLKLALKDPGEYELRLRVTDAAGAKELFRAPGMKVRATPAMRFVPSLSLYTTEKQGEFLISLPVRARTTGLVAEVKGDVLAGKTVPLTGAEAVIPFDLATVADGIHTATCTLRSGGEVIATADTSFIKAPPKAHEVKIDYRSRGLIVEGKPFFPFGFYTNLGQWDDKRDRTDILKLEAPSKFDMICNYMDINQATREARRTALQGWADAVDAVGMKMHYDLRSITDCPASPEIQKQLTDEIASFRDLPSLLCWYLADEPDGSGRSADRYEAHRAQIRKQDPYHPSTMVFCVPPRAHEYARGMDIMMVDPYPIPSSPITSVSDTVDLVGNAVNWTMPIWCVPQAFGGDQWWAREPTWQEQRCMTWLAIAHGATGIQYFIRMLPHQWPFGEAMWAECRKMAAEVRELTPVLLSHEPQPTVAPVTASPWLHLASRAYDGRAYLICVNTTKQPANLAVRCTAKPTESAAEVLFEDRAVPVAADGTIRDMVDALGVRIYAYRTGPAKVNQVALAADNLIKNGGFEAQANVGFPDYFNTTEAADNGCSWGTDPQEAIEGRHSLFIRCPKDCKPGDNFSPAANIYPMSLKAGKYVLSFYMKADRKDGGAHFGLYGYDKSPWKDADAGLEWHKETLEFEVPANTQWVYFRIGSTKRGTLWVDALEARPAP